MLYLESPGRGLRNVDDFVPEDDIDDQFFTAGTEEEEKHESESTSESAEGNPQVAIDEDLSSAEEPFPILEKKSLQTQKMASLDIKESESSSEDEEQETVSHIMADEDLPSPKAKPSEILKPVPAAPPKATPPLHSARDIVLTDTESEDEEEEKAEKVIPKTSRDVPIKKVGGGGLLLTHHSPSTAKTHSVSKPVNSGSKPVSTGSTGSGLLLDFGDDDSSPSVKKKSKRSSSEKSHKKKKSKPREDEDKAAAVTKQQEQTDPFGFDSLDAWLAGDVSCNNNM